MAATCVLRNRLYVDATGFPPGFASTGSGVSVSSPGETLTIDVCTSAAFPTRHCRVFPFSTHVPPVFIAKPAQVPRSEPRPRHVPSAKKAIVHAATLVFASGRLPSRSSCHSPTRSSRGESGRSAGLHAALASNARAEKAAHHLLVRRACDEESMFTAAMLRAHTIPAQTHGRYLVRDGPPQRLFLGFHGYAQTAEIHMEDIGGIPGLDAWTVVAVQALNRFYAGRSTEPAACWMTRQDRELAIADNIAYVRAVAAKFPEAETIVVEGFSQGVAMAYRAAAHVDRVAGAIVVGGDLPPDVDGPLPPILIARGEDDDWYTDEKLKKDLNSLAGRARVETGVFKGRHEWTDAIRSAAGEFLSRVLTGQHVDESAR